MNKKYFITFLFLTILYNVFAQSDSLRKEIEQITKYKKAEIGFAVYALESKDTFSINGNRHFPMQSVFKFHIALAVLSMVDKGNLSMSQKIFIKKSDLLPETWSPIRDKYTAGNIELSIEEILKYTVSHSDNNGCDILLKLIGGKKTVNDYIHKIGIKDFSIQANEEEMHKEWNIQFSNWTSPNAAVDLLKMFYEGEILSKKSNDFLLKTMMETSTGKNRIPGQLPSGTKIAHKTGTSGTNEKGVSAAVNDIGIVTLPNGNHYAICVFISNSLENETVNEKIISDISMITWNYFTNISKNGK
jgi:beta-lactamase class A